MGFYALPSGANYGFLDEDGLISSVSDLLTTSKPPVDQLLGLNDNGQAAGFYNDAKGNSHASTWDRITRIFTPVTPPGATSATAINDRGTVAGFFTKANGKIVSFVKQPGGPTAISLRWVTSASSQQLAQSLTSRCSPSNLACGTDQARRAGRPR